MRRGAGDFFRVEVERDFELDMIDVGGAVARPFCLDVLRLKRAASTGERDGEGLAIAKVHRQLIEKSRLVHGGDVMNRGSRAQTGKEARKIECGAPRPAPPAGVTPAPGIRRRKDAGLRSVRSEGGRKPCHASSITMMASFGASVSGDFVKFAPPETVLSRILPAGRSISRGSAVKFSATTMCCAGVSRWNTRQSSGALVERAIAAFDHRRR